VPTIIDQKKGGVKNMKSENGNKIEHIGRRGFLSMFLAASAGTISGVAVDRFFIGAAHATTSKEINLKNPQPVDLEKTAMHAYLGYYEKGMGCCHGVFKALAVPEFSRAGIDPAIYGLIVKSMRAGKSGVADAGSICGSLLGAAFAFEYFFDSKVANEMQKELHRWYSYAALPIYNPGESKFMNIVADPAILPSTKFEFLKTTAFSPECHPSIAQWMDASWFKKDSPERRERCGRLTADVAIRAGMIWNQYLVEGKFDKTPIDPKQATCAACHDKDYIPKGEPAKYKGQSLVFDAGSNQPCRSCHPGRNDRKKHPYRRIERRLQKAKR
jgi:hypothetical protein